MKARCIAKTVQKSSHWTPQIKLSIPTTSPLKKNEIEMKKTLSISKSSNESRSIYIKNKSNSD